MNDITYTCKLFCVGKTVPVYTSLDPMPLSRIKFYPTALSLNPIGILLRLKKTRSFLQRYTDPHTILERHAEG